MKIQYIITLPDIGGAQSHVLELIASFRNEHQIQLIVGKYGWLTDKLAEMDISYIVEPSLVREISICNDCKAVYQLRNHIKNFQPDIVHCHSSKAGIVGRLAAKLANVPVVFTAHGWAFTEGVSPKKRALFAFIERMMFRCTNKVICVSDYDCQLARKEFCYHGSKLLTIHNGIKDTLYIKQQYTAAKLIMVARFNAQKNQRLLVEAVKELSDKGFNIVCTLVGDGSDLAAMERYIHEHDLENIITLTGARDDIGELLLKNDIFCLISNYEGLPISIIEAMRAGLPIIASDVGGVHELIDNAYNGYLVEKDNLQDLKEKLCLLLGNTEKIKELGKNSRMKYKQEFSAKQMINKIQAIYNEVVINEV